ncbi:DUF3330 domain-containing protein [Legionella sp. 27cVA30]|uniref:DUF3330 domain-containing protein n=1 Tax=Legionella sp. 27cVA30 TaxID=2905657 RepID=UPI00209FBEB3|nr:DUF3330 domain-containing protein [Legionella sp. 27cVA30]MCP0913676.1 DUF3330 domain-containing protein [Legionella sp. 27cVA30]
MDILGLIKQRRAVRAYSGKKVHEKDIESILKAGQYAPSPLNSQPWHFTLIKNRENLRALAEKTRHASFLSHAQLLILVTVDTEINIDPWLKQHNQHIYSAAAAMQNMWLAAQALGIGCCWVTLDDVFTRERIALPKEHALIGGLALGYPQERLKPHAEEDRKPLSQLTSFEQFSLQNCETESCFTCLKLVPKSAANSFEGEGYVRYFCGNDCYAEWRKRTEKWLDEEN